jgi:hypothetical protein
MNGTGGAPPSGQIAGRVMYGVYGQQKYAADRPYSLTVTTPERRL